MISLHAWDDALFGLWHNRDSPGCALAVLQNAVIVCARVFGMADLRHDVPIAPTSVVDIGSTSKHFTAA
jgi:CubicO group peptidase (beta-lactamase class C family)